MKQIVNFTIAVLFYLDLSNVEAQHQVHNKAELRQTRRAPKGLWDNLGKSNSAAANLKANYRSIESSYDNQHLQSASSFGGQARSGLGGGHDLSFEDEGSFWGQSKVDALEHGVRPEAGSKSGGHKVKCENMFN